jgi:hypothetical protein
MCSVDQDKTPDPTKIGDNTVAKYLKLVQKSFNSVENRGGPHLFLKIPTDTIIKFETG